MNNSDIIAALSLGITAVIFLVQTDDGLLRLKAKSYEKWIVIGLLLVILILINHEIFERFSLTFYFEIGGFYFKPPEWALILFLYIAGVTLYRVFSPRIFNTNPTTIQELIQKYRNGKKWDKLLTLLNRLMDRKDFDIHYAENLDDTIFNDHHLIEYLASNSPETLIKFSSTYPRASINRGDHFFHILNGLFADKSNSIFSEIRHYHNDTEKRIFLEDLSSLRYHHGFTFDPKKDYRSKLPIISWLTRIIISQPSGLKEEIQYFFRQYSETAADKNNRELFSETEINRLLSRDSVYNAIQLFSILLVEFSLVYKKSNIVIDRVLLLMYSSWEHIEQSTNLKTEEEVALNNDSYTINEYLLKGMVHAYLLLFFLLQYTSKNKDKRDNGSDSSTWPMKQLFAKLDSLIGHTGRVSDRSKSYYMALLFELYFEMPEYFGGDEKRSEEVADILLWYINDSLKDSPYGDVRLFREVFYSTCESYDFLEHNTSNTVHRAKNFYSGLLPYTKEFEWRITQSMH